MSDKNAPHLIHRLRFAKQTITILQRGFPIHAPIATANDGGSESNKTIGWAMTEKEDRLAREREEIAARVASFRPTQEKFEREREEYYDTTLANAWTEPAALVLALKPTRQKLRGLRPIALCRRGAKRIFGEFRREFFGMAGTKPAPRRFLSSAATLREVKARKTPSASSDVGGVFNCGADGPHAIASHAIERV